MASWKFETEWRRGCAVKVEKLSCKVEEERESFNQIEVEVEMEGEGESFNQLHYISVFSGFWKYM